jgi:hypothetical protein
MVRCGFRVRRGMKVRDPFPLQDVWQQNRDTVTGIPPSSAYFQYLVMNEPGGW